MHPLLLLITLMLLATSALSTKQSNPQKLRPGRILESQDPVICRDNRCYQGSMFNGKKATYSVLVPSGSQLSLETILYPDDQDTDLILYFEADPSPTYFHLIVSSVEQMNKYEQFFFFEQPKTTTTVTGPIGSVWINFQNAVGNPEAHITVIIVSPGHNTPVWVIPVSVSIGVLILATVAVLCYRRKRRNRQRTLNQPVQIRHQNRRQRNQNARPRKEANPPKQFSTKEIIDMRFPEARFERFKSDFQQKTCTICLDDMKKGQMCRQLDCQHIFHTECGKQWLENQFQKIKKAFCPNCNQQVDMLNPKKCPKTKERRV